MAAENSNQKRKTGEVTAQSSLLQGVALPDEEGLAEPRKKRRTEEDGAASDEDESEVVDQLMSEDDQCDLVRVKH